MRTFNRISILALSCLLGSSLASAQDFSQKVDLNAGTRRLPDLVAELATKSSTPLLISNQLAQEVIFMRLKDVTLADAMSKLAEAVGGEWVREGSNFRLIRTPSGAREESEVEIAARAQIFQKAIREMVADVEKTQNYTENEARQAMQNMQRQMTQMMQGGSSNAGGGRNMMQTMMSQANMMPGNRAIARLVNSIDPKVLASMAPGSRLVFSSRPTRMQRALSGNPMAVAQSFVQEQKAFNNAMQTLTGGNSNEGVAIGGGRGGMMMVRGMGGMMGDPNLLASTPFKVILVAQRFGSSDSLSLQLNIYNDQGQSMGLGFSGLSPAFLEPTQSDLKPQESEQPIELSALSKEFKKMMQQGGISAANGAIVSFTTAAGGGGPMRGASFSFAAGGDPNQPALQITPEWRERILNPEKNDPLGWIPNDIFTGIAQGLQKNMVVQVPDSLVLLTAQGLGETGPKPTEALLMMKQGWSMTIKDENGWIVSRPDRPSTAAASRINRNGLGTMLRTLQSRGRLSLDDMANFVISQPITNLSTGFTLSYARLINQGVADQQLGRFLCGDDLMLRFYGTLNQAQRNVLANGQRLPIQGLSQDQRNLLSRMVFDGFEGPQVSDPNSSRNRTRGPGGGGDRGGPMGGFFGSLSSERTEALPNGLPGDGFLSLRIDRSPAVLASTATGTSQQMLTADRLAWTRTMASRPEMQAFAPQTNFTNFQLVTEVDYNFTFALTPNVSLNRSLEDAIIDPNSKKVAYDDLPADFRSRVEREAREQRERMEQGMRRGGGGGRGPGGQPGSAPPAIP